MDAELFRQQLRFILEIDKQKKSDGRRICRTAAEKKAMRSMRGIWR